MIISNKKLTEHLKKYFKKSELDDVELIFDYINKLIDDKNYGEHSIGVASRDLGVSSELFHKVAFYFRHSPYTLHEHNIHVLDPKVLGNGNTDEDYKEYVKLRNTCDLLIDNVSFDIYLALKDQLPLKRFIKNLIKGHVFGLFSINSHVRVSNCT